MNERFPPYIFVIVRGCVCIVIYQIEYTRSRRIGVKSAHVTDPIFTAHCYEQKTRARTAIARGIFALGVDLQRNGERVNGKLNCFIAQESQSEISQNVMYDVRRGGYARFALILQPP